MESSYNSLKSLRDTLLEYAVLNVDLLFLSEISKNDIVSIPKFPRNLFDEILEKSNDMCWFIERKHLISCLSASERLRWSETSRLAYYGQGDLNLFSVSKLESLKMHIHLKKRTDVNLFEEISRMADTLEDLYLDISISMIDSSYSVAPEEIKNKVGACKPLKLKRLRLKQQFFEWFPYTLVSDNLTVLGFHKCFLTKSFLRTLIGFKRLVQLSLYESKLDDVPMHEVIESVVALKSLRLLNLCIFNVVVEAEVELNKIMIALENLEILELWNIRLNDPSRLLTPKKKLKVLNFRLLYTFFEIGNVKNFSPLKDLAERLGHFEDLNGILTIISTTPTWNIYRGAIKQIFYMLETNRADHKMLIEADKKGVFVFRSPLRLDDSIHSSPNGRTSYGAILKMVCYGVIYLKLTSCRFLDKWIREYVERYGNTHLANRFTRLLEAKHTILI